MARVRVELTRRVVERIELVVDLPDGISPEDEQSILRGLYEDRRDELESRWAPDDDCYPVQGTHTVDGQPPDDDEATEFTYTEAEGWAG